MIFLYADGASRGNPGPASYGCVLFDQDMQVIAEMGENLGIRTNNYAEYQGVIAGLRYLQEQKLGPQITIRMDSKLVIEQLAGRWKIKHPEMRELAFEASRLLAGLDVTFEWIPRELNSHADALGNRALDDGDFESGSRALIALAGVQPKSIRAPRQTSEPTTIVVIRHGHTIMTEGNLISGSNGEDPSLSDLGMREAALAAKETASLLARFGLAAPSSIYHSPQLRTTQTAEFFEAEFGLKAIPNSDLREIGFGSWEGVGMDEIETRQTSEVEAWRGSITARPPGGESVADLEKRVLESLEAIIASHSGQSVILVSHMMPSRAIARRALKASQETAWSIQFSPASVSIYRFFGRDLAEVFSLNSSSHLPAH